ncbi:FAD-dependent monooxygenase, partial [Litorisediminicola beolgyonensis]
GCEAALGDAPKARGVVLRRRSGRPVLRLDLTRLGPEMAYRFVHRADLVAALASAATTAGAEIVTGARATPEEGGVGLEDGTLWTADLVIGADGLHSVLRSVLNGEAPPRFTGQVAWRATVPNVTGHPDEAHVHMGPGRHLVTYPLRGGSLVNLVAVEELRDWVAEGWSHRDDPAALRAAFGDFSGDAGALLAAVETPYLWGLFRHPVAPRWWGARSVLLGDAAHPTLPFLAQGANMALEDAWVLARMLARHGIGEDGLSAYAAARRDRVARVLAAADGNARKYHLREPIAGAAHLALGIGGRLAPGAMMKGFDWLYRHDVTA